MIHYRCPRCRKTLTADDREAGAKLSCPHCSQRLQVPVPPPNRTVLGTLDEPNRTAIGSLEVEAEAAPPAYAGPVPPVPRTVVVPTEPLPADLPPARPAEPPDLEHDAPPRPRRRSRRYDDENFEDDDYDRPRPRRPQREGRPCPRCGCTDYPRQVTKFGGASIALLIIGIFFWPLILVAFFMQEKWEACPECGDKLRQIGTGF